jgi:hypothetical protein
MATAKAERNNFSLLKLSAKAASHKLAALAESFSSQL